MICLEWIWLEWIILISLLMKEQRFIAWTKFVPECQSIPSNPNMMSRRPGDGGMEIYIELMPPNSANRKRSKRQNKSNKFITNPLDQIKNPTHYLEGRNYWIEIRPKAYSSLNFDSFTLESVCIVAVPISTIESQEFEMSQGRFTPTICSNPSIGYVNVAFNFTKKVQFLWSSPLGVETKQSTNFNLPVWDPNECLELRVTIVPSHWHRFYYKNTGSLRHKLCLAKDIRKIEEWFDLLDAQSKENNINSEIELDNGYYNPSLEEMGSCSVQELPKPVRSCCACNTAIYRLIIKSDWQQQQHWKDWPVNLNSGNKFIKSPHWSEILGNK